MSSGTWAGTCKGTNFLPGRVKAICHHICVSLQTLGTYPMFWVAPFYNLCFSSLSWDKVMGKPPMLCREIQGSGGGEWNLGYLGISSPGPILQSTARIGIWHHCGLHHFRMLVC